jgi:hypothetical protein
VEGPEREDVGGRPPLALDLLRGHVARGSQQRARRGVPVLAGLERGQPRQTEVEIFAVPSAQRKTFPGERSRWTMARACAAASPGELGPDAAHRPGGTGRSPGASERLADQPLGDEVGRLAAPRRGDRARVAQATGRARLPLEAGEPLGIGGEALGQRLQRHVATEPGVTRPVHLAHSAPSGEAQDLVRPHPLPGRELRRPLGRGSEPALREPAPGDRRDQRAAGDAPGEVRLEPGPLRRLQPVLHEGENLVLGGAGLHRAGVRTGVYLGVSAPGAAPGPGGRGAPGSGRRRAG